MPYNDKVFLDFPDETTTEKPAATGEIREFIHPTYGKQLYRLVRNTSGGVILAGRVTIYASGSSLNVTYSGTNAIAASIAGITVVNIPDDSYGWVVCSGQVVGATQNDVDADDPVFTIGAAGQTDDATPGGIEHCVLGIYVEGRVGPGAVPIRVSGIM